MTQPAIDYAGYRAAPAGPLVAKPTYYVVLHTQSGLAKPSTQWEKALRLLAALAEENPGYLGYEVREMTGGGEYAVTHWADARYIAQWKNSCRLMEPDAQLLHRIFGKEGCIWPWMTREQVA
ncbi:MAG: hypothetical protein VW268_03620 [Rhodospirillaceae bacterium]